MVNNLLMSILRLLLPKQKRHACFRILSTNCKAKMATFWILFSCILLHSNQLSYASSFTDIIDLTYSFGDDTVYWPSFREYRFNITQRFKGIGPNSSYVYEANVFCTAEHGGTHLDAPRHFAAGKLGVSDIPLQNLIGNAVVIDVSTPSTTNKDYLIGENDFINWENTNGRIPDGSIILLKTGFGAFWPDVNTYLGSNSTDVSLLHFPGLHVDGANWLMTQRKIKAVGIDTASIDYGQSTLFPSHVALMTQNIPVFENVAGLDQLTATGFTVIALPMKIKDGSGGPLRIIAVKMKDMSSSVTSLRSSLWCIMAIMSVAIAGAMHV